MKVWLDVAIFQLQLWLQTLWQPHMSQKGALNFQTHNAHLLSYSQDVIWPISVNLMGSFHWPLKSIAWNLDISQSPWLNLDWGLVLLLEIEESENCKNSQKWWGRWCRGPDSIKIVPTDSLGKILNNCLLWLKALIYICKYRWETKTFMPGLVNGIILGDFFFFTFSPPPPQKKRSSKYRKVNLGKVRCI